MSSGSPTENTDEIPLPIRPDPVLPLRTSPKRLTKMGKRIAATIPGEGGLTRNQLSFVNFYCRGLSARAAMIKAGYSPNNDPHEVLYNPKVWKEVQKRLRVYFENQQITTEAVLERVHRLANSNILDYVDILDDGSFRLNLTNVSRDQGEAIQALEFDSAGRPRIRLVDKIPAVTLEARLKGMLSDKLEVSGKDGGPLTIQAFDSIIQNTTINNIQINQTQGRHDIPETIDALDALTSDNSLPVSDAQSEMSE